MKKPTVTILMPVYNAEKYIKEAIESIINQTFTDFEFLIIDDGSSDNSLNIINNYKDNRIRLYKNEQNIKLISTLNKGIELAKGKYIARMDADDISLPQRIEKQVEFMEKHPEIGALGTAFISFDDNNKYFYKTIYPSDHFSICVGMLYKMQLCHSSVIIRSKTIIDNNLRFSLNFLHAEDYDFFYRLSRHAKLANLKQCLYKRRLHNEQVSNVYEDIQKNKSREIIKIQFNNIGVNLSDAQIDIFTEINYCHYQKNFSFLKEAQTILESINEANNTTKIYDTKLFQKYLQNLWFNVCTNLTSLGLDVYKTYKKSKLINYTFNHILLKNNKLLLKSLLKI